MPVCRGWRCLTRQGDSAGSLPGPEEYEIQDLVTASLAHRFILWSACIHIIFTPAAVASAQTARSDSKTPTRVSAGSA